MVKLPVNSKPQVSSAIASTRRFKRADDAVRSFIFTMFPLLLGGLVILVYRSVSSRERRLEVLLTFMFAIGVAGSKIFNSISRRCMPFVRSLAPVTIVITTAYSLGFALDQNWLNTALGGFWGLLIGLPLLAPIFWALLGALVGGIQGKTTDLGIDNKFIKEVGDSLDIGGSVLFMLVAKATPDNVIPELQKYGSSVHPTSLQ